MFGKFFNPKSIAVIGASQTPESPCYNILENIKTKFLGKIYPITEESVEIMNLTTYPSLSDIEEAIDLAIISVPKEELVESIKKCIVHKIKSVIIISDDLIEEKEKEQLKTLIHNKLRVLGPNTIGVYNSQLDVLSLKKEIKRPKDGHIGVISKTNETDPIIFDFFANNTSISKFVSIGGFDANENDLLTYFRKDLQTRCIVVCIENFTKGKDFIEIANKTIEKKPIICLKAGKYLEEPKNIYSVAFKQAGIIEANSFLDLTDWAKILASQPLPETNKIGIITNTKFLGDLAADSAVKSGLEVVKLTISENAETYKKILTNLFKDKQVSSVICIAPQKTDIIEILQGCKLFEKPIAVCMPKAHDLEKIGIPVYPTPERAAKAMSILFKYKQIKEK